MAWLLIQVVLGAGPTQVQVPTAAIPPIQCRQVIIQNNSGAACRVGDNTVSAAKGIYLSVGPGGGSFNTGPSVAYNSYATDFWIFGTAASVIDVFVNT